MQLCSVHVTFSFELFCILENVLLSSVYKTSRHIYFHILLWYNLCTVKRTYFKYTISVLYIWVTTTILNIKISITQESSFMSLCCQFPLTPSPRQPVNCFQSLQICFALRLFKIWCPTWQYFLFSPPKKEKIKYLDGSNTICDHLCFLKGHFNNKKKKREGYYLRLKNSHLNWISFPLWKILYSSFLGVA